MSAELALMNQVLNKALASNAGVEGAVFNVPINSGSEPITEGDTLQVGPDGKVYPYGFKDVSDTSEGVVSKDTTSVGICYRPIRINDDVVFGAYSDNFRTFKYNASTGFYDLLSTTDSVTLHDEASYWNYLHVPGCIVAWGPHDSSNFKVVTILINGDTGELSTVTESATVATSSYYKSKGLVQIADTTFLGHIYTSDNGYSGSYKIEVNTSTGAITLSSEIAQPVGISSSCLCTIGWKGFYIGATTFHSIDAGSGLLSDSVTFDSSGDNSPYYVAGDVYSYYSNTLYKKSIYSDGVNMWHFTARNTYSYPNASSKFVRWGLDNDGNPTVEKAYSPAMGYIHLDYDQNSALYKANDTEFYVYYVNNNEFTPYNSHTIIKITLDGATNTYTHKVVVNTPIIGSSTQYRSMFVSIINSSQLVGGTIYSYSETAVLGTAGLQYTKTKMQATSDIPADTSGTAIANGVAFKELSKPAGNELLGKYIKTDTNYAIEIL